MPSCCMFVVLGVPLTYHMELCNRMLHYIIMHSFKFQECSLELKHVEYHIVFYFVTIHKINL
jgi:hypothetical protein